MSFSYLISKSLNYKFLFLLSITLVLTIQQVCNEYNRNYSVCFNSDTQNFIFYNCTSQCKNILDDSPRREICLGNQTKYYSQNECSNILCPSSSVKNLKACLNVLQGNTISNTISKNQAVIIICVVLFILIAIFCIAYLRRRNICKFKKPRIENPLDSSFSRLQIQSSLQQSNNRQISSFRFLKSSMKPVMARDLERQAQLAEIDSGIMNMEKVNAENFKNEACSICLNCGQINCQTTCHHFYHLKCILQWMKRDKSCPQCRNRFFWPIKIFCIECFKTRDAFKFTEKNYLFCSHLHPSYYEQNLYCIQCKKHERQNNISQNQISDSDVIIK